MSDMWKSRSPPTPLEYEEILDGTFKLPPRPAPVVNGSANAVASGSGGGAKAANGVAGTSRGINGQAQAAPGANANGKANGAPTAAAGAGALKDQRALTLRDNLELFVSRYVSLFLSFLLPMPERGVDDVFSL